MKTSIFSWIEIPVVDMDRAVAFYEAILGVQLQTMKLANDLEMSFIPSPDGELSGALCKHLDHYTPSSEGTLIYLRAHPNIEEVSKKIKSLNGKMLQEKRLIKHNTYMALFIDCEGNRMALMEEN